MALLRTFALLALLLESPSNKSQKSTHFLGADLGHVSLHVESSGNGGGFSKLVKSLGGLSQTSVLPSKGDSSSVQASSKGQSSSLIEGRFTIGSVTVNGVNHTLELVGELSFLFESLEVEINDRIDNCRTLRMYR